MNFGAEVAPTFDYSQSASFSQKFQLKTIGTTVLALIIFFSLQATAQALVRTCISILGFPSVPIVSVPYSSLRFVDKVLYGAVAFDLVKYNGRTYIYKNSLNKGTAAGKLSAKDQERIASMTSAEAQEWLTVLSPDMGSNLPFSPMGEAAFDVAASIATFEKVRQALQIKHNGRSIVPNLVALVRNKENIPIGSLFVPTPGRGMDEAVEALKLTERQIDDVFRQAREQLTLLAENGIKVGDIGPEHLYVTVSKKKEKQLADSPVNLRLIEFDVSYYNFEETPKESPERNLASLKRMHAEAQQQRRNLEKGPYIPYQGYKY